MEPNSSESESYIGKEYCHLIENPIYCNLMKSVLKLTTETDPKTTEKSDQEKETGAGPAEDLSKLTNREYLEDTVVPILMKGLTHICNIRPPDPVSVLAAYIVKNKQVFQGPGKKYYTPRSPVKHVLSEM